MIFKIHYVDIHDVICDQQNAVALALYGNNKFICSSQHGIPIPDAWTLGWIANSMNHVFELGRKDVAKEIAQVLMLNPSEIQVSKNLEDECEDLEPLLDNRLEWIMWYRRTTGTDIKASAAEHDRRIADRVSFGDTK